MLRGIFVKKNRELKIIQSYIGRYSKINIKIHRIKLNQTQIMVRGVKMSGHILHSTKTNLNNKALMFIEELISKRKELKKAKFDLNVIYVKKDSKSLLYHA